MGNFEKLSVVVIVVIIVMILVVALHTWTDRPDASAESGTGGTIELVNNTDKPLDFPPPGPGVGLLPGSDSVWDPTPMPTPEPRPVVVDPKPATGPALTDYVVQAGDTLGKISQEAYGSTRHVQAIRDANPGLGEYLREGQTLKMPDKEWVLQNDKAPATETLDAAGARPGGTYTTRKGDTWERISLRAFKTKDQWPKIYALNSAVHDSAYSELPAGLTIQLPQ